MPSWPAREKCRCCYQPAEQIKRTFELGDKPATARDTITQKEETARFLASDDPLLEHNRADDIQENHGKPIKPCLIYIRYLLVGHCTGILLLVSENILITNHIIYIMLSAAPSLAESWMSPSSLYIQLSLLQVKLSTMCIQLSLFQF